MQPNQTNLSNAAQAFQRGELEQARQLAEDELAEQPDSPDVHHLLGLIDCRSGRFSSGVRWLRSAAEARPNNVQFCLMLLRALIDAGLPKEALEAAPRPSGVSQADIALWHARAEAADAARDARSALDARRAIASARPSDPRAWIDLARTYLQTNRFEQAQDAYERALQGVPADVEVIRELGMAYYRNTQFDRLAELLDKALGNAIDKDSLSFLWAARKLHEGDLDGANKCLNLGNPTQDRSHWYRLKARIADAQGDSAGAFEATNSMNRSISHLDRWRKRGATYRAELREVTRRLTPALVRKLHSFDAGVRQVPAFLVGLPRSGTTLLDTFLMGHPEVCVLEEEGVLSATAELAGPLLTLSDQSLQAVERLRESYFQMLDEHLDRSFRGRVIEKAPLNMLFAPLMCALFGRPPIIFAKRHPCDVVLSAYMQNFSPNLGMSSFFNLEDAADFYDAAMTFWTKSCEILPLEVHVVTYERLIGNPQAELRGLIDFLGLKWNDRVLDHVATAKKRGTVLNASYDQIVEPLTTLPSGRWKRYQKQLEPVLPILLPWARRLGYED